MKKNKTQIVDVGAITSLRALREASDAGRADGAAIGSKRCSTNLPSTFWSWRRAKCRGTSTHGQTIYEEKEIV